jgi:hypothetical protein
MKSGQPCDASPVFFFAQKSLKIRRFNVRLGTPLALHDRFMLLPRRKKRHYKKLDVDVMDNE